MYITMHGSKDIKCLIRLSSLILIMRSIDYGRVRRVKPQILYFSEDFETFNILLIHFFQHLVRAVEK